MLPVVQNDTFGDFRLSADFVGHRSVHDHLLATLSTPYMYINVLCPLIS